jgi:hypothetical protein
MHTLPRSYLTILLIKSYLTIVEEVFFYASLDDDNSSSKKFHRRIRKYCVSLCGIVKGVRISQKNSYSFLYNGRAVLMLNNIKRKATKNFGKATINVIHLRRIA